MRYLTLFSLVLLFAACESEPESGLVAPGPVAESVDEVMETEDEGGVVMGRVVDAQGNGVSMANISVLNTKFGVAANSEGTISISGLPPGTHLLRTTAAGTQADTTSVDVMAGDTTMVEIVLN